MAHYCSFILIEMNFEIVLLHKIDRISAAKVITLLLNTIQDVCCTTNTTTAKKDNNSVTMATITKHKNNVKI